MYIRVHSGTGIGFRPASVTWGQVTPLGAVLTSTSYEIGSAVVLRTPVSGPTSVWDPSVETGVLRSVETGVLGSLRFVLHVWLMWVLGV